MSEMREYSQEKKRKIWGFLGMYELSGLQIYGKDLIYVFYIRENPKLEKLRSALVEVAAKAIRTMLRKDT